ncbi:hypothetical protein [Bacillus sp. FJAT-29814]|nr:hypothetical protein [Bacillus sp. FJAT-29814]
MDRLEQLLNYLNQLDNIRRHDLSSKMETKIDEKILKVCCEIEVILKI